MSNWQLAQLNIAHLLAPIDSPTLSDFVSELDRINALAENSNGFVWRLISDENAQSVNPFGDDFIVNLSVWESVETLFDYVYRTAHKDIMKQRKKWFKREGNAFMVLWWVPAGHQPTETEAKERLDLLQRDGPSKDAFTFKTTFAKPS